MAKIIDYSSEWHDKLITYLKKIFPTYLDSYIEYCIHHSTDRVPSIIVINDNNDIVGCHLYFCTKALIKGEIVDTQWGHDTFLDPEYRAEIGLDLILRTIATKSFGIGLTDINEKIQKKLKAVFFKGVYTYYTITRKVLYSPFQALFHIEPKLYDEDSLSLGGYRFHRVKKVEELEIPNRGFWFNGMNDIEFVRDDSFLKERFLDNKVHKYIMYTYKHLDDNCYFVVRKTHYRGMPALTLSDYRYTNADMIKLILDATKKIARKSNIGIILFVSGDHNLSESIKGTLYYGSPIDFVANNKMVYGMTFCITGADSDADFFK